MIYFPHSLIMPTMGLVVLANNIKGLVKQSMNKWKTKWYADGKLLGSEKPKNCLENRLGED